MYLFAPVCTLCAHPNYCPFVTHFILYIPKPKKKSKIQSIFKLFFLYTKSTFALNTLTWEFGGNEKKNNINDANKIYCPEIDRKFETIWCNNLKLNCKAHTGYVDASRQCSYSFVFFLRTYVIHRNEQGT